MTTRRSLGDALEAGAPGTLRVAGITAGRPISGGTNNYWHLVAQPHPFPARDRKDPPRGNNLISKHSWPGFARRLPMARRLPGNGVKAAATDRRGKPAFMDRSLMIEFDVECRSCKKLITLRVHDEQSRVFFEQSGALCEDCYERDSQRARIPCAV